MGHVMSLSWRRHQFEHLSLHIMATDAEQYEQQNVHEVYQHIADHFSSTRYKVCLNSTTSRPS